MKKLLILVMLLSMGLAGIASAERGKFTYYRWDNGNTATSVQQYQRDFSTAPTSKVTVTRTYVFPISNTVSTGGLETPTWENGGNIAGRFEGYILPPADGNYTFWVSSDDASELWLSTDENPANAVKICGVSGWTGQRAWTSEAGQKSVEIPLVSTKAYFFYGTWKEGGGGDGISIAWGCPQAFIAGPTVIDMNYVSNTATGFVKGTSNMPGAVEYDLWDPKNLDGTEADVSTLGVINGIMPDFSTLPAPTSQGTVVTFSVGPMAGTDDFIYRQYGIIKVPAAGVLSFTTSSDDGSKLYVGNWWQAGATMTMVVNNDGWHGMQLRSGSIAVAAGYVGVMADMYEDGGGEGLEVYYYSDTIPVQQIPATVLLSRNVANNPSPAADAMGVALGTALSWEKPVFKDGVTNNLLFAESGQPLVQVYSGTGTTFAPTLAADKYYTWRVDTSEPNATPGGNPKITKGRVWGFSTAAAPVAKRLVAYWPLDADLADASGNLVPGQYFSTDSSAPVFEPGMKGNALAINIADTTKVQYAKLADYGVPALSTTGISGNMPRTISCWVKPAVVPIGTAANWCNIFGFTSLQGSGGYVFDFNKFGGNEQYCITRYGFEGFMANIDADWHFLTATYDNGTITWYTDGRYVNTSTGHNLHTQDIVHIGKRAHSNPLWQGWIDEARIYNYALTGAEVYQLYVDSGGTPFETCLGTTYPTYDFDKNCKVDINDFAAFSTEWLFNAILP